MQLIPNALAQFIDSSGAPLASGSVGFYFPGTLNPKATYQDMAGTIANPNPVPLNSRGQALIWGSGVYRQIVKDASGVTIWDQITEDPNAGLTGDLTDAVFVAGTNFTPGTTTQLTLPAAPGSLTNTWIFFDAAYQDDAQATVNGTTLTFASPIPLGVGKVTVKIGTTVAIGTPNPGTVTDASVATGSNLYNRIHDIISVKDFGAKGDGVTNDQAAIQAAATAASGKVLLFPAGSYVVKDGFSMTGDNSDIMGYGATLIYNKTTATFDHCIRLSGNHCSISGIEIQSPSGLVRDDTGFGISLGLAATATTDNVVQDCTLNGIASAGIWVTNVSNVRILNNNVINCLADGIHLSNGCNDAIISANTLASNGDDNIAAVTDLASPSVSNVLISGNTVIGGTRGHGVALIGVAIATVSGNMLINTPAPGVGTYQWMGLPTAADGLLIECNEIVNCGIDGVTFGGCGINLSQTAAVTVRGNVIRNIQFNGALLCGGIRCASATELVISDNHLYNLSCDGILVTGATSYATATGNVFGSVARIPVNITGTVPLCIVSGNVFNATSGGTCISVNLPSSKVRVSGNTCDGAVSVTGNSQSLVSLEENFTFTPTITAGSGGLTAASGEITYQQRGSFMYVEMNITITTNGSGATNITATLPFPVLDGVLAGRESAVSGKSVIGAASGSTIKIFNYDNTYPGASGAQMTLSGLLRIQ